MFTPSKKSLFSIGAVIVFLLLQGCAAPNVKLSSQDRIELKKLKSVKAFHMPTGWPTLKTPLGVLAADLTFGLSNDWTEGQKLVKKFKIKNPSLAIKKAFVKRINSRKKSANFVNVSKPLKYGEHEIENMQKKYKKGVVLQIIPGMWQIWYYPFNWGSYQMWFRASARLVRLDDAKVLWSSACVANQDTDDPAPSLDELTADKSKVLQNWVKKSTSQCAKQLANDFLAITAKK